MPAFIAAVPSTVPGTKLQKISFFYQNMGKERVNTHAVTSLLGALPGQLIVFKRIGSLFLGPSGTYGIIHNTNANDYRGINEEEGKFSWSICKKNGRFIILGT